MRDRAHYEDMLDRNPTATVGVQLAAKMIAAARNGEPDDTEALRDIIRRLKKVYGEFLTNKQVRDEMAPPAPDESVSLKDRWDLQSNAKFSR